MSPKGAPVTTRYRWSSQRGFFLATQSQLPLRSQSRCFQTGHLQTHLAPKSPRKSHRSRIRDC